MKRRCSKDWKDRPKGGTDCMGIGNTCSISMFASPSPCMWWPPKKVEIGDEINRRWWQQTTRSYRMLNCCVQQFLARISTLFLAYRKSTWIDHNNLLQSSWDLQPTARWHCQVYFFNQKMEICNWLRNILRSTAKLRGKEFLLNNNKMALTWSLWVISASSIPQW